MDLDIDGLNEGIAQKKNTHIYNHDANVVYKLDKRCSGYVYQRKVHAASI